MVVVRNLYKRGNVWIVRVVIPADLREQWGKAEEIVSLNTSDEAEALARGTPILAEIKAKIAAMRTKGLPTRPDPQNQSVLLTPDSAERMIRIWRRERLQAAEVAAYNGNLPRLSGNASYEASERLHALSQPKAWETIEDFNTLHSSALGVTPDHPALVHSREIFRRALLSVETTTFQFREGQFPDWDAESEPEVPAKGAAQNRFR
jgi:hypothetical protein